MNYISLVFHEMWDTRPPALHANGRNRCSSGLHHERELSLLTRSRRYKSSYGHFGV
jgi:hypothetical protein